MSERAVMTTWMLGSQSAIYLHDDRVEVGTTDPLFNETLARVAYRDARALTAWTATRRLHLWIGAPVLAIGAVLTVLSVAALAGSRGEAGAFFAVLGAGALVVGGMLTYMGRPRGITRFRLEGARGDVEGVLSGSRARRAALLREIERRIRDRQTPPLDKATPVA